jgi:type IV secretion system protein VirB9
VRAIAAALLLAVGAAHAATVPPSGEVDPRIRTIPYNPDDVIELRGHYGYSILLQLASNEKFIDFGSGKDKALQVDDAGSLVGIKPISGEPFTTNLTIITDRRVYQFAYTVGENWKAAVSPKAPIFTLRFTYPQDEAKKAEAAAAAAAAAGRLATAPSLPRNTDYWFCGSPGLKPEVAWDDGAQTHLRLPPGTGFPEIEAQDEAGQPGVANFNVVNKAEERGDIKAGDIVIHGIAGRFILRRGGLVGCVVNKAAHGVRLPNNAIAQGVERVTKEAP